MAKERPTIGVDGRPLPVLPPERDPRVWARLVRVMFYTPGFMAILLLRAEEPASFGVSVGLLMLASASAVIAGLFVGAQSDRAGATSASRSALWSGSLVLELLCAVPFLCAVPALFYSLASGTLHAVSTTLAPEISLDAAEVLPAIAVIVFLVYELADFGTLPYVVPKPVNWAICIAILVLISGSYAAHRSADFPFERHLVGALLILMGATTVYGVLRLRRLQAQFDANAPPREKKDKSA